MPLHDGGQPSARFRTPIDRFGSARVEGIRDRRQVEQRRRLQIRHGRCHRGHPRALRCGALLHPARRRRPTQLHGALRGVRRRIGPHIDGITDRRAFVRHNAILERNHRGQQLLHRRERPRQRGGQAPQPGMVCGIRGRQHRQHPAVPAQIGQQDLGIYLGDELQPKRRNQDQGDAPGGLLRAGSANCESPDAQPA